VPLLGPEEGPAPGSRPGLEVPTRRSRGRHRYPLPAVSLAAGRLECVVLRRHRHSRVVHGRMRHALEHVHHARAMSGLRASMALDDLSSMRRMVAARRLVRRERALSARAEGASLTLNITRSIVWFSLAAVLAASPASAQEKLTERTFRLKAGMQSPPATISDMAWLAGHWAGEALGGLSEEIWSDPGPAR
jgi:hypothetical protein